MGSEPFRELGRRLSNWGRWGDDDEVGAVNLMTPERIVAAAGLVRTGKVFDLGIPIDAKGPQPVGASSRINPVHLVSLLPGDLETQDGTEVVDDWIIMPTHASTQWDGLAHIGYDGRFYNGVPTSAASARGVARLGIEKMAKGIVGRGVLLDIAALRGVDWLAAGDAISPADLEAAEERQGVSVGAGDVLLFRTGWWEMFRAERDLRAYGTGEPGLSLTTAEWLRERDVAVVAADNWAVEVKPPEESGTLVPLHCVLIRDMGVTLGELLDLGELARDCAADGVWEFLFCSPALKITGGVGSPANPLAIK